MVIADSEIDQFNEAIVSESGRYGVVLNSHTLDKLEKYYRRVREWSPLLHLVAPCTPREFATRHVLESLMALRHLPDGARVADVGSGGGLPIIPCLAVRGDLQPTLIESSARKVVFLRETLRDIQLDRPVTVITGRFENTPTPPVEFVTCRALDKFASMLPRMLEWSPAGATLLLFAGDNLRRVLDPSKLNYATISIPGAEGRFLLLIPT